MLKRVSGLLVAARGTAHTYTDPSVQPLTTDNEILQTLRLSGLYLQLENQAQAVGKHQPTTGGVTVT